MAKYTPAQNRASQKYQKFNMEEVKIRWPRAARMNERIAAAAAAAGIAKREYIAQAIESRLRADGYEALPPSCAHTD